MKQLLLVFIGGGFGSALRFVIGKYMNSTETGIPWGTFTANILGSLIIGIILGLAAKNDALSSNQTLLLATGFCGGFTTFSTFSLEVYELLVEGRFTVALAYMAATLLGCLLALAVGITAARWVMGH